MQVDAVGANDLASYYYYLQQSDANGLSIVDTVDNCISAQILQHKAWQSQDLLDLLCKIDFRKNKFYILKLLRRGDILVLLNLLNTEQLIEALQFFPKSRLLRFIHLLPTQTVIKMMLNTIPCLEKDPASIMRISRDNLDDVLEQLSKSLLIRMLSTTSDNFLRDCVSQLPDNLLVLSISQLDDTVLGSMLVQNFPDLMTSLAKIAA